MNTRIWLNQNGIKAIQTTSEKEQYGRDFVPTDRLNGVRVKTDDKTGKKFVEVSGINPVSPAVEFPEVAHQYVKQVTFIGTHDSGFRQEGVYRLGRASAVVEIQRNVIRPSFEGENLVEIKQQVSISAPTLKTLQLIYAKIRSGKLEPAEAWTSEVPMSIGILIPGLMDPDLYPGVSQA